MRILIGQELSIFQNAVFTTTRQLPVISTSSSDGVNIITATDTDENTYLVEGKPFCGNANELDTVTAGLQVVLEADGSIELYLEARACFYGLAGGQVCRCSDHTI